MARAGTLSKETLAALGAERLAELLLELGEADAGVRKRLVLAAAEGGGPAGLAKAVDRRLKALAAAQGWIGREKTRALAAELEGLRAAIAGALIAADPAAAADRLFRFIALANELNARTEDGGQRAMAVFGAAVDDLGAAWGRLASADGAALASQAFALIEADEYDICGGRLITAAAPALGPAGLDALAAHIRAAMTASAADPKALSWRDHHRRLWLRDIADARGDVDAYIALELEDPGGHVDVIEVAERLLAADRAEEALAWLDRPPAPRRGGIRMVTLGEVARLSARGPVDHDREVLRVRALSRLGRRDEAQAVRWRLFETELSADILRDYIRALDDFEEFDALDRAFEVAMAHRRAWRALAFFTTWNKPALAARLVEARLGELDPQDYELLAPAAEALEAREPRAATRLYRRMIDDVLARGAAKAYPHAARHLAACAALAPRLQPDDGAIVPHEAYVRGLRERHGRKYGFWGEVKG